MKKRRAKRKFVFCVVVSFFLLACPSSSSAPSQAPSRPPQRDEAEPKIVIDRPGGVIPVGEEVKILRQQRRQKMPYLDKGHIKESITAKSIGKKQSFTQKRKKTLEEVVGRAVDVYTPAKAAKERITLAKRRILAAARELLPGGSFNFQLRKGSLSADSFTGKDYHLTFRVPVFRGGILWNTLLKEKAEYRAAKKEYDAVLNELVDEVSNAYFEYQRALLTYEDKSGLAERTAKQLDISRKKYAQALISEIESLNVESMAGQTQYDVETAEQELELAKLELQRFLDLDIGDPVEIVSLYDAESLIGKVKAGGELTTARTARIEVEAGKTILGKNLDEFVDLAYTHRPELQVESERLRAARLEEKISRGVFQPRADLVMEFGELAESFIRNADDPHGQPEWRLTFELSNNLFGNKLKHTFDTDENAPSVAQFQQGTGSQVTNRKFEIGIFDGLEDYAEAKEAEVKKLEQVIELEKKEREVIREVKEAYFDYHKAEVQVESSLKRNQYRQKLVSLAQIRLEKTEIEISEFLQAELDLSEERARLHRALADLFKAKSKLNRAIGIRDYLIVEERYGL